MIARPSRRIRLSCACAAGAVASLGQEPLGLWPLALLGFAGVLWGVGGPWATSRKASAGLALAAGFGYFALFLNWIIEPFLVDAATFGWMAPFAVVFLAMGLSLFWVLAALAARVFPNRILGLAVTLTLAELARGYVFTGFPWALIGHLWIGTPADQVAALVGPSGLTLLVLLPAALLLQRRALPVLAGAALWAGALGFGFWTLSQPLPIPAQTLTLRLVQPNAAQALKWDPDQARAFLDRQLAFSRAEPAVDLVIWPETSLPYNLDRHPELWDIIAQSGNGAPVVVGMQRVDGELGWNNLTVIGPDGLPMASYDKHHLVPFGEYIPFGDLAYDWFGISAFAAQTGNSYSAGTGPALLDLGAKLGRVLPLICYEAVFPQDLRGTERPDWLLQITNDAWFGTLSGPYQHAAQASLRAVEQGLPLVRVANTGVTAVYDARGRETASLPFATATYLDATLPAPLPITPYARWGEGPVLVLLAGLAAALFRRRILRIA